MAIKLTAQASRSERERETGVWNKPAFTTCNKRYDKSLQFHGLSGKSVWLSYPSTNTCLPYYLAIGIYRCFSLVSPYLFHITFEISECKCDQRFITIIDRCMCMCLCSIAGGFCAVKIYSFQVARWSLALFSPFVLCTDNHEHRFWCKRWIRCH